MHDIGNGVFVPEGDWLVPMRGETQLAVELEMPGWPEPDMVQVRQYACINREYACGSSSRTWHRQQQPRLMTCMK